jgi:hypothetical protein
MENRGEKIRVAFHKGEQRGIGKKLVSGIIKLSTYGDYMDGKVCGINQNQYSHTELIFPSWVAGQSRCFSSRGTAKPSGVAFLPTFEVIDKHPDRWDFLDVSWIETDDDIAKSFVLAKSFCGKKYAYNNVLNTFSFIRTWKDRNGKDDWWCSEACSYAISLAEYKVSPNRMYTLVETMNRLHNK